MPDPDKNIRQTVIIHSDCREAFLTDTPGEDLRRRGIELAGCSELKTAYRIARAGEAFHVVFFSHRGGGHLWAKGVDAAVPEDSLFVVPAGTPHEYRLTGPHWEVCWLHLAPERTWHDIGAPRVETLDPGKGDLIRRLMGDYLEEAASAESGAERAQGALAELIEIAAARLLIPGRQPDPREAKLREVWREVGRSLRRPWTVAELAAAACRSERQFYRDNLRYLGEKPTDTLCSLRIERADEYLRATAYSLETIADLVGFSGPYALSNAYARRRGMRPKEARKLL